MVKPVRHAELRARMAALLRRAYPVNTQSVLEFGPYRFLTTTNSLEMHGQPIEVTHREYTLALTLFQNQGRLLSREQDRKSTRLNSSHLVISYAVFCLKKKT